MKQEYHTKMFNFGQKYDFKQYDNIITIIMVDLLMAQNSNDWSCATSEFYNCYRKHILFTKSLWPQTAKGPFYLQVKLPLATCNCMSVTDGRHHTILYNTERQAEKLSIPNL